MASAFRLSPAIRCHLLVPTHLSTHHHHHHHHHRLLLSRSPAPSTPPQSNNQFCRYLYYTGRISALQLEYGDAYTKLLQSLRKAPQNTAAGFRRTVQKLMVIVQLLMGEVSAGRVEGGGWRVEGGWQGVCVGEGGGGWRVVFVAIATRVVGKGACARPLGRR